MLSLFNLKQSNSIKKTNNRLLDLVLTDLNIDISLCSTPLINVDPQHPPLECELRITLNSDKIPVKNVRKYNFHKADYDKICQELTNIDWSEKLGKLNTKEATDVFYAYLYNILNTHVPWLNSKPYKYPIWFSQDLKKELKIKLKFRRRWKTYGNRSDYDRFSWARENVKKLIASCNVSYVNHVEASTAQNIKHFWKYTHNLKNN